jgi:hypothetical protein
MIGSHYHSAAWDRSGEGQSTQTTISHQQEHQQQAVGSGWWLLAKVASNKRDNNGDGQWQGNGELTTAKMCLTAAVAGGKAMVSRQQQKCVWQQQLQVAKVSVGFW